MSDAVKRIEEALLEAIGEISAIANLIKLQRAPSANVSTNVNTGQSTAALVVVVACIICITLSAAAVTVIAIWRNADARVFDERMLMQAEKNQQQAVVNEDLLDRVRLLEVKVKKLEEKGHE